MIGVHASPEDSSLETLCCAAYSGSKLVGAVASRLEPQVDGLYRLYIMTLGVYAAYREQRIGETPAATHVKSQPICD